MTLRRGSYLTHRWARAGLLLAALTMVALVAPRAAQAQGRDSGTTERTERTERTETRRGDARTPNLGARPSLGGSAGLLLEIDIILEGSLRSGQNSTNHSIGTDLTGLTTQSGVVIAPNAVDEITVELTDFIGNVYGSAPAFVRDDYSVVDLSGSPLFVSTQYEGLYFVRVRHRNHLSVMSTHRVDTRTGGASVDFTDAAFVHGGLAVTKQTTLPGSPVAIIAGDAISNGAVNLDDRAQVWQDRQQSGYVASDVNLDGTVNAADRSVVYNNLNRQAAVADFLPIDVETNVAHSCVLGASGIAQCFGMNSAGQLGDGSLTNRAEPMQVITVTDLIDIDVGIQHSCGVRGTGRVVCWGSNAGGRSGQPMTTPSVATPLPVAAVAKIRKVATGAAHTCALDSIGAVWCWGSDFHGSLGRGTIGMADHLPKTIDLGTQRAVAISAGYNATCALRADSSVWCWGEGLHGQLGDGADTDNLVPAPMMLNASPVSGVTQVSVGDFYTCVRFSSGSISCTGNLEGPYSPFQQHPRLLELSPVVGLGTVDAVEAGTGNCALASGVAHCWGQNTYDNLGHGPGLPQLIIPPAPVLLPRPVSDVSIDHAACAVLVTSEVYCWGRGDFGQTGAGPSGPNGSTATPLPVTGF